MVTNLFRLEYNVHCDHNFVGRQTPDVHLVDVQDQRERGEELVLQGVHVDLGWHRLEQDQARF